MVTWDGGGNLAPFRALVQELLRRQHDVTVLSEASARQQWKGEHVRFKAWGPDAEVVRSGRMPEAVRIPPLRERLWLGPASAREFRDTGLEGQFDAYVIDHSLLSCGAVAEALELPAAVLYHSCR